MITKGNISSSMDEDACRLFRGIIIKKAMMNMVFIEFSLIRG